MQDIAICNEIEITRLFVEFDEYIDSEKLLEYNYFEVSHQDARKIGYLNKSRFEDHFKSRPVFNKHSRKDYGYHTKPAKLMMKLVHSSYTDNYKQEIARNFANKFAVITAKLNIEWTFEETEDFSYYLESKYFENTGNLGNSCMKYEYCQVRFQMYKDLGVKLVILKNNNNLIKGRALLWPEVDFGERGVHSFMDRIYVNDDKDTQVFLNYAKEKGYVAKRHQTYTDPRSFVFEGKFFAERIAVPFDMHMYDCAPYIDTLSWYDTDEGCLTNYETCVEFKSTSGEMPGSERCTVCGDGVDPDECSYVSDVGYVCDYCLRDYFYCEYCDQYVHVDHRAEIDNVHICESCIADSSDFCECHDCGCWIGSGDSYYVEGEDIEVCSDCFDNYTLCEKCEKDYASDVVECVENENVCENCYDDETFKCKECNETYLKENHDSDEICDNCAEDKEENE